MKDLLYVQEHTSCANYFCERTVGFKYYELEVGQASPTLEKLYHHIFFILKGTMILNCNEFQDRYFKAGECILVPKSAEYSYKILASCQLVVFTFDNFLTACDKLSFKTLIPVRNNIFYNFEPISLRYPLTEFLDLMTYYLRNGMNCNHLHDLKGQELFLIFRGFYTKEELSNLFYQVIGKTIDFKGMIMKSYRGVDNINELASLFNMSRANFDSKFKEEFGMPPYQWLLKQKAKHVKYALADPDITLSDVMNKYNFNSPTHFNRFCKQQFGCSPTELIKTLRG